MIPLIHLLRRTMEPVANHQEDIPLVLWLIRHLPFFSFRTMYHHPTIEPVRPLQLRMSMVPERPALVVCNNILVGHITAGGNSGLSYAQRAIHVVGIAHEEAMPVDRKTVALVQLVVYVEDQPVA